MTLDRHTGPGWRSALVLAAVAVGCARFQPVMPLRARSADVEVVLKYLRIGRFGELVFAAHAESTHVISQAWLTVPTRSPCTGGQEVNDLHVDGHSWVLPAGDHEISVWPNTGNIDLSLDTVVDIETDQTCIRVPAVSQSLPLDAAPRPALVSEMTVLFTPTPVGLRAFVGLEGGVGVWLGAVQVIAQAGYASAICQEWACGRDAQGNLRSGAAIPVSIEARRALGVATVNHFANVFFLEGSYTVTPFWLPLPGGDRRFTAQSVFGEIGWGFVEVPPGPLRHLERAAPIEMAIPLGVTVQTGGGNAQTVFSGGLVLRLMLPL